MTPPIDFDDYDAVKAAIAREAAKATDAIAALQELVCPESDAYVRSQVLDRLTDLCDHLVGQVDKLTETFLNTERDELPLASVCETVDILRRRQFLPRIHALLRTSDNWLVRHKAALTLSALRYEPCIPDLERFAHDPLYPDFEEPSFAFSLMRFGKDVYRDLFLNGLQMTHDAPQRFVANHIPEAVEQLGLDPPINALEEAMKTAASEGAREKMAAALEAIR